MALSRPCESVQRARDAPLDFGYIAPMSSDPESSSGSDSFASLFEQSVSGEAPNHRGRKSLRVGQSIKGVVVRVGHDAVFVEVDGKQQAFIDAVELRDAHGEIHIKEGETLTAQVVEVDEARGHIRLGRSMGKTSNVAAIEQARAANMAVTGKVTGVNKGGLEVDLGGARAFCPISQADNTYVQDAKSFIGQSLEFLVTDIKDGGKNVVVSRRAFLERRASENATQSASAIVVGATMRGSVTSVRDFGAFVDLGGIEGMIPRSEIAHDRSVGVADALKAGDIVEVQVRDVKDVVPERKGGATKKITLSLKALTADPWNAIDLPQNRVITGTVTRTTEFGVFVRLASGIEGLLHVSEIGGPKKMAAYAEGTETHVVIKKIDAAQKKISLAPAPDEAELGATVSSTVNVAVGAIVKGVVERIETYGVFVQIDGTKGRAGRGLVPSAELGVARGTDLRKVFPEGTKLTVKVLETGEGKLRMSVKAAKDDEERADFEDAKVKNVIPKSLGTFGDLLKKHAKK
jgi:small subunit ribosomal protein S1